MKDIKSWPLAKHLAAEATCPAGQRGRLGRRLDKWEKSVKCFWEWMNYGGRTERREGRQTPTDGEQQQSVRTEESSN
ncbi:hypothetical protein TNCV_1900521 [Trichonephila clavipes]|nr:hypothetical protein TNCV_1900521 [Trichonephila clavipes]